jgi:RHS repeat-associated protein
MQADISMTEMLDYRARYYNPTLGRFISEDPVWFSSGDADRSDRSDVRVYHKAAQVEAGSISRLL